MTKEEFKQKLEYVFGVEINFLDYSWTGFGFTIDDYHYRAFYTLDDNSTRLKELTVYRLNKNIPYIKYSDDRVGHINELIWKKQLKEIINE